MHYETDDYAIIQFGGLKRSPRIITKKNLIWEDLTSRNKYDSYLRAAFLGQGCWDRLSPISADKAMEMLKEWGVGDSDSTEVEQLRWEILLKNRGEWVESPIGEIPSLIWSMVRSCFPFSDEDLAMWFRSEVSSYGDRIPFDMLREDDGFELFHELIGTWKQMHG